MAYDIDDFIESYEMLLGRVQATHARLRDELIPQVAGLVTAPIGILLPPGTKEVIRATVQSALQTLRDLTSRVELHLLSAPLPIRLHVNADVWALIATGTSAIVGDLRWENRPVPTRWRGVAAETYEQVVAGQASAVRQLGAAAQAVTSALNWVAMSALLFFVGLLALLIQVCAILVGAVLLFMSGIGIPAALTALSVAIPGLVIQVTALGVVTAEHLARGATMLDEMRTKALDMSTFPNGAWPRAEPARYNDATVTDGDPSDWTVSG